MKKLLESHKGRLLIAATILSLVAGAFTIKEGESYHSFGFPDTFLILSRHGSGFPLGINPLQFAANVGAIWLILFLLSKAVGRLALLVRKKMGKED